MFDQKKFNQKYSSQNILPFRLTTNIARLKNTQPRTVRPENIRRRIFEKMFN